MKKDKYALLSADYNCKFTTLNSNNSTLDLTSIINTLESQGNPLKLFNSQVSGTDGISTENSFEYLLENINNITKWLNRTAYPSLLLMKNADLNTVLNALYTLCDRVTTISKEVRVAKRGIKSKWQKNGAKTYHCNCICNKPFTFSNNGKAWDIIQEHNHIEECFCFDKLFNNMDTSDSETFSSESDTETVSNKSSSNENDISVSDISFTSADSTNNSGVNNLEILKVIYPLKVMTKVAKLENNKRFYTVQKLSEKHFRCLLCLAELNSENNVYQHVVGNAHTNALSNPFFVTKVVNYHEIFSKFPVEYYMQTGFFVPYDRKHFLHCKLCSEPVKTTDFKDHIVSQRHKVRISHKKYTKYYFYAKIISLLFFAPSDVSDSSEKDFSRPSVQSKIVYNSNYNAASQTNPPSDTCLLPPNKNEVQSNNTNTDTKGKHKDNGQTNGNQTNISVPNKTKGAILNNTISKPTQSSDTNKKPAENGKHDIRLSVVDKPCSLLESLEKRFEDHKVFIKYFDDKPVCVPCAMPLDENKIAVKIHFLTKEHAAKVQLPKISYRYICDICPVHVYTEHKWVKHLKCTSHKQRITNRVGAFLEYECTVCKQVIFGNEVSVKKHIDKPVSSVKKAKVEKEIKLPLRIRTLFQNEERLHEEIAKLVTESQSVLKSVDLSWQCCIAIQDALTIEFGQCRAYPFGSRISGLGSMMSDLDVFVDTGDMYEGLTYQDAENQANLVKRTAKIFKKHPDFADINSIPSARTPIVQVFHKVTGLDCDLSFRHGLSVENTTFLRLCIDVQPSLKELILMLKYWSGYCKLNARISTYALSMLSIFFMQIKGYLLSVKKIREIDPTEPKIIGGWRSFCFTKPVHELQAQVLVCDLPIKTLLRNFFNYYSLFKFDTQVVCPLLGRSILKTDFHMDKGRRLPSEMSIYVEKINLDDEFEVFRSIAPMCIQDPFDLSHNLTKACMDDIVKRFVTLCKFSCEALT